MNIETWVNVGHQIQQQLLIIMQITELQPMESIQPRLRIFCRAHAIMQMHVAIERTCSLLSYNWTIPIYFI